MTSGLLRVGPHATGHLHDHLYVAEDLMSEEPRYRHGTYRRRKVLGTVYAGPTTCLRCDIVFESWDRRQNRLCRRCQLTIDEEPSDEESHRLPTFRHLPQSRDDE
jgi:hypothetical protein